MAPELGFNGEDAMVYDKEREGGLEEAESCSGDWPLDEEAGGSTEGGTSTEGGVGFSWESAGEEPLGEGAGVTVLDASREMISKGFVFTWDDGSMMEGRVGEGEGEGEGRDGREGKNGRGRRRCDGMSETHAKK